MALSALAGWLTGAHESALMTPPPRTSNHDRGAPQTMAVVRAHTWPDYMVRAHTWPDYMVTPGLITWYGTIHGPAPLNSTRHTTALSRATRLCRHMEHMCLACLAGCWARDE